MSDDPSPKGTVRRVIGGVFRRSARAFQWLFHPWYRHRALGRLRALGPPTAVVVLCHGNICRSPMAEQLLRRRLRASGQPTEVASAGFIGPDRPSPPAAVEAARDLEVELGAHRSRLVTPAMLAGQALVVVMEPYQARDLADGFSVDPERIVTLGDLDPAPFAARRIPDPIDRPREVFAACYRRLDRCTAVLASGLSDSDQTRAGIRPERRTA